MSSLPESLRARDYLELPAEAGEHSAAGPEESGLVNAILQEIADHLKALIETGVGQIIDVRSLPMSDADREELKERLGEGEVTAQIEVAGLSTVEETAFPGIWWVRHEGGEGKVSGELIEITDIPQILVSPSEDMASGLELLKSEAGARSRRA